MPDITIRPDPGGRISEPGFYRMNEDRYHGDPCDTPSASSSLLKLLTGPPEKLSMLHAWAAHPRLGGGVNKDTDAMRMGRAAHMAAFEPDQYARRAIILDVDAPSRPSDRQRNAKKPSQSTLDAIAYWDEIAARVEAGGVIVKPAEAEAIAGMGAALSAHREARALLSGAESEVAAFWRDAETGVWCRAKFDRLPLQRGRTIPDYKTCEKLEKAEKLAQEYQWPIQAAMYLDGYAAITGEPARGFVMIAQEKAAPYAVAVLPWDRAWLDQGRILYRLALRRFADGVARGKTREHWPGPPVRTLIQPRWAEREFEVRAEVGEFAEIDTPEDIPAAQEAAE